MSSEGQRALDVLQAFRYDKNGHLLVTKPTSSAQEGKNNSSTVDTGIVSLDCEMVGVRVGRFRRSASALARVSIVNLYGYCLYDKFVKPIKPVTDYRTPFSGIREKDLRNALPHDTVVGEVKALLKDHILVGHGLKHDFEVLGYTHPVKQTRDTSVYYKELLGRLKTPGLKELTKTYLHVDIQQGEHNSIIDAQAAMALYVLKQREWDEKFGIVVQQQKQEKRLESTGAGPTATAANKRKSDMTNLQQGRPVAKKSKPGTTTLEAKK